VENAGMKIFDACPHCGEKLSPWQQVLLKVDRSLMCKNCWYRIILDRRNGFDKMNDHSIERKEE
jgi:DNA-directed RNA polymerase subunit RPC12/RpoP